MRLNKAFAKKVLAATATLALGASNSHATLLVYEGFDYTNSGSVDMYGQSTPLNAGSNFGFVAGSSYKSGTQTMCQPGSLFYAGTFGPGSNVKGPSVGGKIRSNIGGGSGNYGLGSYNSGGAGAAASGARPFGAGTNPNVADTVASGTYYYSFLWANQNASSAASGYVNVFCSAPNTDAAGSNAYQDGIGVRFTGGAFGVNSLDGGATVAGTNATGVAYNTAPAGTVYLIVGKTVINNLVGGGTTNQFWVNPTTFATDGTITGGYASGVANLNTTGTGKAQKMSFGTRANGGGGNNDWYWDEVRVGTDLADVVSIVTGPVSATWNANNDGTWSANAFWTPSSPTGLGTSATFASAITAPHTVTVDSGKIVSTINFDNANKYTIGGTATLTIDATTPATGAINVISGSHDISAPLALAQDTTVTVTNPADTLKASSLQTTAKALTKAGAGLLEVNALNVGAATVNAGKLKISEGSIPATVASDVGALNIAASAQLDVTNTALIVRSSDATSAARNVLWQKIIAGQNGVDGNGFTNWDGPGIVSSSARTNNIVLSINLYAVGIIANHDLDTFYQYNATNGGWLNGAITNIGVNDILIRYTYNGDSNLDGSITIADYVAIDSTYGGTATNLGWVSGDFNNDGSIGIEDYVAIDTAYAFQTGSLSQSLLNQRLVQFGPAYVAELQSIVSSLSAVPEPATMSVLALGAVSLLSRRRKV